MDMKLGVSLVCAGLLCVSGICVAEDSAAGAAPEGKMKAAIDGAGMKELAAGKGDIAVDQASAKAVRSALWEKYMKEISADETRKAEMQQKNIKFNKQNMKFDYVKIGEKPAEGYPLYIALHGGGNAPASLNDSQWNDMKRYYRDSVKCGIYTAVRGISNDWNLHFMGDSYVMYDRLIEDMIAFENVDPNHVYVLGYSAGGDGVYQISTRMPDRFAAANMSAGHHNGVSPRNLYNLPFLIQVGEKDGAYDRNKEAVKYSMKLDALKEKDADGYEHAVYVHLNRPHNYEDNDPRRAEYDIMAKPNDWLAGKGRDSMKKNTNAIDWLSPHKRNPLPAKVIWDLTTGADRSGKSKDADSLWDSPVRGCQNYWLEIPAGLAREGELVVKLDKASNTVVVETPVSEFAVLLNSEMFDLSKPVKVTVGGKDHTVQVKGSLKNMAATLLNRGDSNYVFEGRISVKKDGDAWKVE